MIYNNFFYKQWFYWKSPAIILIHEYPTFKTNPSLFSILTNLFTSRNTSHLCFQGTAEYWYHKDYKNEAGYPNIHCQTKNFALITNQSVLLQFVLLSLPKCVKVTNGGILHPVLLISLISFMKMQDQLRLFFFCRYTY